MKSVMERVILKKESLSPGVCLIEVEKKPDDCHARPGQFYNIQAGEGMFPLLRRPISVSRVTDSTIQFVIFIKGQGTQLIAERPVGNVLNLMGPFGNGYALPEAGGRHLVLAGGIGIAPQQQLINTLSERKPDHLTALLGYRNKPYGHELYEKLCDEVFIATEDGSQGHCGTLAEPLTVQLARGSWDMVYACGPHGMLKAVAAACNEAGIPVQLLMEERMACGIGACLVCACKVKSEANSDGYENVRTCKDGPVFFGTEVIFNE